MGPGAILGGYKVPYTHGECVVCEVKWKLEPGQQPRCWICGRFGKRTYLHLYGPESRDFSKPKVEAPYLGGLRATSGSDRPGAQREQASDIREAPAVDYHDRGVGPGGGR